MQQQGGSPYSGWQFCSGAYYHCYCPRYQVNGCQTGNWYKGTGSDSFQLLTVDLCSYCAADTIVKSIKGFLPPKCKKQLCPPLNHILELKMCIYHHQVWNLYLKLFSTVWYMYIQILTLEELVRESVFIQILYCLWQSVCIYSCGHSNMCVCVGARVHVWEFLQEQLMQCCIHCNDKQVLRK